ncbi:MAG: LamG-like jellyroll fold domain-containing protein [Bacteroidota bacterium]
MGFWMKPITTNGIQDIFDEGGATNGFGIRLNGSSLEVAAQDNNTIRTISNGIVIGEWTHVTATFDNGLLSLFINGILVNQLNAPFNQVSPHSDGAGLGATNGSNAFDLVSNDFNGLIDDIYIFDYAVTTTDIASLMSPEDAVTIPDEIINTPEDVTATAVSHKVIDLTWNDTSDNEINFQVFRSTEGGEYESVALLPANSSNFSDSGLETSTTYSYKVIALGNYTESDVINEDLIDERLNLVFEESVVDVSDFGTSNPVSGNLQFSNDSKQGASSILFNGSTHVDLDQGNQFIHDAFNQRSFAFWFKNPSINGTEDLLDEGGSTNGIGVRLLPSQEVQLMSQNGHAKFSVESSYSLDTWHHVAAIFDNGSLKLYLDGVLQDERGDLTYSTVNGHGNAAGLGRTNGSNAFDVVSNGFSGLIDDFKVFQIAINDAQIEEIIASTNPANQATTLALPSPPSAVSNLTVADVGFDFVDLSFGDTSTNEDHFEIWRSINTDDNFVLIDTLQGVAGSGSILDYTDPTLVTNIPYYYRVDAVNDGGSSSNTQLLVNTLNHVPEIDELTDLTIRYNSLYELQLFATDVDSDALTITMGNAPAFTTFTDYGDGSALASFSPLEADQGVYDSLSVTVSDGFGGQVVQYFTLTINNNFAPDLSPISDINVVESQSVMVNLTASDVEGTENLLWSSDLPDFATLTPAIDGTATLEVAPDFIDGGVYAASVTVADPEGAENEQSFVINVAQKSPYTLVQVNFTDGSLLAPAGWNNTSGHPTQGDTYSNLVDIDGDATAIGVSIASNWTNNGSNNLGSNTGNDSGIFPDNVIQSAYWTGGNTESITVNGLNDANTYNLTFFGSREAGNDRTTRYTVGGQSVTLDAASNTSQTVSLNNLSPVSGEITFTVQRAAASAYGYINALVVEERFDTGLPPALPSNLTAAFDMNANEVNLSWTDRAFDEVGYRVYRSIDGGTTFTLLVELPENSVGFSDNQILPNTTFYYQVSPFNNNGENLTAPVEAVIPNVAPIIAAIADSSLQVGSSASIDISATDAPGDVITLGLATPYPFVTLTDLGDGNGQLNITPGVNDIGIYTLTITAVDQNQESSSESFELTIEASGTHHYYINFAGSTNFSAASPWNNYIGGGASGSTLNGIDAEENSFPTLSMTIQDSWNGFNSSGMTGSSLYPNQVTQTSLWTSGPQDKRFLISGLASNKAYDFTFFASRDGGGNRTTNYTINGTTVSLNASFNQDQTVTIEGIIPDSNGEILIIANKDASASYGYINAIVIEGYDAATIPAHPTELTATPLDEISIELNWKDNTNLETAYEVFRAENSDSNYSLVHAGAPNITTWTDQQTTPDVTYYYKVRAILDDASQTIFSNVSATSTIKATININFNVSDPQLTGGWNNTNSAPDPGLIFSNLQNSQGNNTGIAFEIVADNPAYDPSLYGFSGDNPFGENTGSDSGVVPDNVMRSTWWMDPNKTAELRFFNLDLSQKYKFTFFASRAGTGNRTSAYSINGTSVTLNAAGNTSQTVDINDVLPDQNGEILLSITSDAGALFSYIGAIIMQTSNTDPTKASNFARNEQTGFDQIENANGQIEIYPNPIQNGQMLTILLNDVLDDSNANARIMDSSGNVIISQRLLEPDNLIFDLDALTDGLYILQITNGQSNTYHRIIKK